MDDLTETKWESKAHVSRVLGVDGYPEEIVVFWVEANGVKIVTFPPILDGPNKREALLSQQSLMNYLVDLHNLSYKLRHDQRVELGEAPRGRGRPKQVKKLQAPPGGAVQQPEPVQAEDRAVAEDLQPKGETQATE